MSALQVIRREFLDAQLELLQEPGGRARMTSEQIGLALGYAEPRKSILKLYERNREELEPYRAVVRLTTPSGTQEVTCWKREAVYAFGFLARTDRARAFRAWAARVFVELEDGGVQAQLESFREALAAAQDLIAAQARVIQSNASVAGSMLAQHGHRRRRHPELYGLPTKQQFIEFYEAELVEGGALPASQQAGEASS